MVLNIVEGRDYETYNNKEVEKEHKEEITVDTQTDAVMEKDEKAPVSLGTHVKDTLPSMFSNVEVYINNQQIHNSKGLYARKY